MKKVRAVIVCLMAMVMLTGCLGLNMEMTVHVVIPLHIIMNKVLLN